MRKQLCAIASLFLTTFAGAQTQKGNGLFSGGFSVNYNQSGYQQATLRQEYWQPSLSVTAGRFVSDNWLVGASVSGTAIFQQLQGGMGSNQALRETDYNVFSAELVPFVRRYWQFAPVQVFAGAGLSLRSNGQRVATNEEASTNTLVFLTNQRTNDFLIGPYLEAGANYFLTKRLALQVSAATRSLPFSVASVNTGLVYWTGSDRKAGPGEARETIQTNRRNWVVEGGFSVDHSLTDYMSDSQRNQTSNSYAFSPSVGYFIRKNSLLGVSVPLLIGSGESRNQSQPRFTNNYWSVGIAPYFQHYWTSTRLTPYTRVGASYTMMKSGVNTNTIYGAGASFGMGLAYMAGKRFIIETSLGNASLTYTPPNKAGTSPKTWNADLSAGLQGNFAVRYVLTRPE